MPLSSSPDTISLASFIGRLTPLSLSGCFNPWASRDPADTRHDAPLERRERLFQHLACSPRFILVGEAPGYQGAHFSGLAFTSEKLLWDGAIPRIEPTPRLTNRRLPYSEPSATIVWRVLYELGIAEQTVLWNAFPLHPHPAGKRLANRTPTEREIAQTTPILRELLALYGSVPQPEVIAVGKKAAAALEAIGLEREPACVRHPANGGATKFANGLKEIVKKREESRKMTNTA
jgi:uracil-DNA glycosylase